MYGEGRGGNVRIRMNDFGIITRAGLGVPEPHCKTQEEYQSLKSFVNMKIKHTCIEKQRKKLLLSLLFYSVTLYKEEEDCS